MILIIVRQSQLVTRLFAHRLHCKIFLNDSKTLVILRLGFTEVKEHMVLYIYIILIYIYLYIYLYIYIFIYIYIYTVSAQSSTL